MKNIYSNIYSFNKRVLQKTVKILKDAELVGLPTETLFGKYQWYKFMHDFTKQYFFDKSFMNNLEKRTRIYDKCWDRTLFGKQTYFLNCPK